MVLSYCAELLKIVYMDIKYANCWSIYRYHANGIKWEQIDCKLYKDLQETGYDRVINYCAHKEDALILFVLTFFV